MAMAVFEPMAGATPIGAEDAMWAAEAWVSMNPSPMEEAFLGTEADDVQTIEDEDGVDIFHVVTMDGGGFVVTSADDGLRPIVMFSPSGKAPDLSPDSPLFDFLAGEMVERMDQLEAVRNGNPRDVSNTQTGGTSGNPVSDGAFGTPERSPEEEWEALLSHDKDDVHSKEVAGLNTISDVRVPKLVQSAWDQSTNDFGQTVYNYYTPSYSLNGRSYQYVCGCAATALAQLMRFHRQPTSYVSPQTFQCEVEGSKVSKKMKGGYYAWDNMPLNASHISLTTEQREAIGRLTFDCAVALEMKWSVANGGGTPCSKWSGVLTDVFGYSSARGEEGAPGFSQTAFLKRICSNLDAGYPVLLGIYKYTERGEYEVGHGIVADGYGYDSSTLYVHLNMGWSGSQDLWYAIPNIGTQHGFNMVDDIAYNIYPTGTGDILSGRVLTSSGSPVSGATVTALRNGNTVSTTTSNDRGIYAFRLAPGNSYTVQASKNGSTGNATATLSTSSRNEWGVNVTLSSSPTPTPGTVAQALDCSSLSWSLSGSPAWYHQTSETHDGSDALRSGAISANGSTSVRTTVSTAGTIEFWYKVSSEIGFDFLLFKIDGVTFLSASGSEGWTKFSKVLPAGGHTLEWTYVKDGGVNSGSDCAWLDQVVWRAGVVPVSLAEALDNTSLSFTTGGYAKWYGQTAVTSDESDAARSGTCAEGKASWMKTTLSGSGTLSFYWKVSSESDFDWLELWVDGAKKARISGSTDWQRKTVAISGTGSHTVTWRYSKDGSVSSDSDCGWVDRVVWTRQSSLSAALDNTSLSFTTGGYAQWFGTPVRSADGVDSAQSGSCEDEKASWLKTTVSGAGTLSFYWKVSSEENYDWLELWVDGTKKARISGLTGWVKKTVSITGGGSHTVTWRYSKDCSVSSGADCGWVDQVKWQRGGGGTTLQTALDNTALSFTTGGYAKWYGQSNVTWDGVDAARSGVCTDGNATWMKTTVSGSGTLSFRWKVSSESNFDWLELWVDGVKKARISGSTGWITKSVSISGGGSHTVTWRYSKDSSVSNGSDAGWVDRVQWTRR